MPDNVRQGLTFRGFPWYFFAVVFFYLSAPSALPHSNQSGGISDSRFKSKHRPTTVRVVGLCGKSRKPFSAQKHGLLDNSSTKVPQPATVSTKVRQKFDKSLPRDPTRPHAKPSLSSSSPCLGLTCLAHRGSSWLGSAWLVASTAATTTMAARSAAPPAEGGRVVVVVVVTAVDATSQAKPSQEEPR